MRDRQFEDPDDGDALGQQTDADFQLERLYDWLMDENREPAQTKFTAGTLRNVAKEIEYRIKTKSQTIP